MPSSLEDLAQTREEDPKAFLIALFMRCEAPDGGVDVDALMQVSAAMTSVGVNVPRVVNQHPDLVRDAVGEELTMPERLVDRIDREIDESS